LRVSAGQPRHVLWRFLRASIGAVSFGSSNTALLTPELRQDMYTEYTARKNGEVISGVQGLCNALDLVWVMLFLLTILSSSV
jgi:hypothetical protein